MGTQIAPSVEIKNKGAAAVLAQIDNYISAYERAKGRRPEEVHISAKQYDLIAKEAQKNQSFLHLMKDGYWHGVRLVRPGSE